MLLERQSVQILENDFMFGGPYRASPRRRYHDTLIGDREPSLPVPWAKLLNQIDLACPGAKPVTQPP